MKTYDQLYDDIITRFHLQVIDEPETWQGLISSPADAVDFEVRTYPVQGCGELFDSRGQEGYFLDARGNRVICLALSSDQHLYLHFAGDECRVYYWLERVPLSDLEGPTVERLVSVVTAIEKIRTDENLARLAKGYPQTALVLAIERHTQSRFLHLPFKVDVETWLTNYKHLTRATIHRDEHGLWHGGAIGRNMAGDYVSINPADDPTTEFDLVVSNHPDTLSAIFRLFA